MPRTFLVAAVATGNGDLPSRGLGLLSDRGPSSLEAGIHFPGTSVVSHLEPDHLETECHLVFLQRLQSCPHRACAKLASKPTRRLTRDDQTSEARFAYRGSLRRQEVRREPLHALQLGLPHGKCYQRSLSRSNFSRLPR